jgi:hypothetical protein
MSRRLVLRKLPPAKLGDATTGPPKPSNWGISPEAGFTLPIVGKSSLRVRGPPETAQIKAVSRSDPFQDAILRLELPRGQLTRQKRSTLRI